MFQLLLEDGLVAEVVRVAGLLLAVRHGDSWESYYLPLESGLSMELLREQFLSLYFVLSSDELSSSLDKVYCGSVASTSG